MGPGAAGTEVGVGQAVGGGSPLINSARPSQWAIGPSNSKFLANLPDLAE